MILDATAGNRTIYENKNSPNIIYIDIQKQLLKKPTIFADNTQTPFLSKTFDTIIYDPPHDYGCKPGDFYTMPNLRKKHARLQGLKGVCYYGVEIYKTKQQLIAHIYKAQKEFYRILKDDGLLWLKWNEVRIPLNRILAIFTDWRVLLRLPVSSPQQTMGKHQTYWVCMEKKKLIAKSLTDFQPKLRSNSSHPIL